MDNKIQGLSVENCLRADVLLKINTLHYLSMVDIKTQSTSICRYDSATHQLNKLFEDAEFYSYGCDLPRQIIYKVRTTSDLLMIEGINANLNQTYELSKSGQLVTKLSIAHDIMMIQTQVDETNGTQTNNLYLVNLQTKECHELYDTNILEAAIPIHIILHAGKIYCVLEDIKFAPYESSEIKESFPPGVAVNRIIYASLDDLIQHSKTKAAVQWKLLEEAPPDSYIKILDLQPEIVEILCVDDVSKASQIIIKDFSKQTIRTVDIPDVISSYSSRLAQAYIAQDRWKISVFDKNGDLKITVPRKELKTGVRTVELNQVLAIVDDEAVIFDSTEYDETCSKQVRVIYEVKENKYMIEGSTFVQYCGGVI